MSQQSLFPGLEESSSSPEDFPAPISARREGAWDSSEESGVPSGLKCSALSSWSYRLSSSLRTFLLSSLAGLTPYSLVWKRRVTPRGRWWWALGRSGLRTAGTGFGSSGAEWPGPKASDWKDGRRGNDPRHGRQLGEECRNAEWATPTRRDEKGPGPKHTKGGRDLATDVVAEWPTPTAEPYGSNQGGSAGRVGPVRPSLETLAREWPTPTVMSQAQTAENPFPGQTGGTTLPGAAREESGARVGPLEGESPSTPGSRPGSLNPAWVETLMSAPPGWTALPEETVSRLWETRIPGKRRT